MNQALGSFLQATSDDDQIPKCLFELFYEQGRGSVESRTDGLVVTLPNVSPSLAFDDATLDPIRTTWGLVMGEDATSMEYMAFADREPADDEMSE